MNDLVGTYLSSLDRKLFWMDRKTRKDIVLEVRSHLSERINNGEDPASVLSSFGPADSVARDYLRIYGFGMSFILMIGVAGFFIAMLTVPGIIGDPSEYLGMDWVSLVFLVFAILLVLFTSFKGGRKAGVTVGAIECVSRFIILGILVSQGTIILQDSLFGAIGFTATSLMLPIIGYLSSTKPVERESDI